MVTEPARLDLYCLGPPTAKLGGRDAPPVVLRPKHLALLIYLALSPKRSRSRAHLLGLLWPETSESDARHALNQSLLRLRQALGANRLRSVGEAVVLEDAALDVDLRRFDLLADSDPPRAIALLRGDFLEGFGVEGAPAFEDWSANERERYRARAVATLLAGGEERLAACRFLEACDLARRALALEPYCEPAVRLAMRAAALGGDASAALAMGHEFADRLDSELDEQPSRQLAALRERIRQGAWRASGAGVVDPEPPLVGRPEAQRRAFQTIRAALTHGARTLAITGAPGMGRTRLMMECVRRLALDGAVAAIARPLATDHDAPWSTLRLLLRGGLGGAPGSAGVDPSALAVLSSVAPELRAHGPAREPRDGGEVGAALGSLIAAVAAEQPIIMALDDAHLADRWTLGAMTAAMERTLDVPVVFVLTAIDGAPDGPPELVRLLGEVGRSLRGASVRLRPLTEPDVKELVVAMAPWCPGEEDRARLARRLTVEAGGSPLFVVTLLAGLQRLAHLRGDWVTWPAPHATLDSPLPISIPDVARVSLAARMVELDEASRHVLGTAAVCGAAIDRELLAAVTGWSPDQIDVHLGILERGHFVTFEGGRYAFAAPIVMETVRAECLTRGQMQQVRRRAVGALADRTDLESRVLRAELRAAAESGLPAFEEALATGRVAAAEGALRTARRALAAAQRAAANVEDAGVRAALDGFRAAIRDAGRGA